MIGRKGSHQFSDGSIELSGGLGVHALSRKAITGVEHLNVLVDAHTVFLRRRTFPPDDRKEPAAFKLV